MDQSYSSIKAVWLVSELFRSSNSADQQSWAILTSVAPNLAEIALQLEHCHNRAGRNPFSVKANVTSKYFLSCGCNH